ncbi:MAG: DUF2933 domain-containing protein [Actinomycetia bacterium]|nr:DUF2933 domain-containing protein [Actinomycetes bacterium]
MKRQHYAWYAVALAILIVGSAWVGVPAATLLIAVVVLTCPLMMFMMGGHSDGSGADSEETHGQRPTSGHL